MFALGAVLFVAQPAQSAGNEVADGYRYFVRYCASCHGTDGLGDGPVAKTLVTPPANLRKLGDKYGMPFLLIKLPSSSTAAIRRAPMVLTRCRCGERSSTRWARANGVSTVSAR